MDYSDNPRAKVNDTTITIVGFSIVSAFFIVRFFLFGFGNYNNGNTNELPDKNKGNAAIYGDGPDAPARQTKNTYTDTPETAARANEIRDKLFGKEEKKVVVEAATEEEQEENTVAEDAESTKE